MLALMQLPGHVSKLVLPSRLLLLRNYLQKGNDTLKKINIWFLFLWFVAFCLFVFTDVIVDVKVRLEFISLWLSFEGVNAHPGCRLAQFSSVPQSCPTFCDPMTCSTPGFPVHHQIPEFTQTHVH